MLIGVMVLSQLKLKYSWLIENIRRGLIKKKLCVANYYVYDISPTA